VNWQPIETCPLPEFDPVCWYASGKPVLTWDGWVSIASYGYTAKGKGRWRNHMGVIAPTHWMPLPDPPLAPARVDDPR
jgi:hypothetical protein